ncbi:hypothetical protein ACN082_09850 [Rothia sp. CCM 9417]|uniref:hypothetical protein n=1 Tax=Rothia sp. CCM 9417 TaxID=3402657 RepID=UPI003ADC5D38
MLTVPKFFQPTMRKIAKNNYGVLTGYGYAGDKFHVIINEKEGETYARSTPLPHKELTGLTGWGQGVKAYGLREEADDASWDGRAQAPELGRAWVSVESLTHDQRRLLVSSASADGTLPKLNGACIEKEGDSTYIMATDRYTLTRVPVKTDNPVTSRIFIPGVIVGSLDSRYFQALTIYPMHVELTLASKEGSVKIVAEIEDVSYPEVLSLFDSKEPEHRVKGNCKEVLEAVKSFSLPKGGRVIIDGYGVSVAPGKIRVETFRGWVPSVTVSAGLLTRFLRSVNGSRSFTVEGSDDTRTLSLKVEDVEADVLLCPVVADTEVPDNPKRPIAEWVGARTPAEGSGAGPKKKAPKKTKTYTKKDPAPEPVEAEAVPEKSPKEKASGEIITIETGAGLNVKNRATLIAPALKEAQALAPHPVFIKFSHYTAKNRLHVAVEGDTLTPVVIEDSGVVCEISGVEPVKVGDDMAQAVVKLLKKMRPINKAVNGGLATLTPSGSLPPVKTPATV